MLNVKALKTFTEENKTVLIRFDLNIPLNEESSAISDRITRIKNPIHNLLSKKNKVIILSHLGRPKGKKNDELSLKQIVN
ncbi:phosphoglycerate kinase, partial [Pelagibacteraceae bacterium]|nr:phosphoglycerate kinase [Pelagibacteraceae bacterium]